MADRTIGSEVGTLTFWGAECYGPDCEGGITTPDSMFCESCGTNDHTVALWLERDRAASFNRKLERNLSPVKDSP